MGGIITEKKYPIRNIWLFEQPLIIFTVLIAVLIVLQIFFFLISFFIPFSSSGEALFSLDFLLFILLIFVIFALVISVPSIIIKTLRRSNFHYSLEDYFISLHQGIISKQSRNVPYGRIQGVFVNQRIFDRIFGLASLTFEDFSQGGKSAMSVGGSIDGSVDGYVGKFMLGQRYETLGFVGNKIHIPGLKKDDAEALKAVILQKIKENPIEDSQSGL